MGNRTHYEAVEALERRRITAMQAPDVDALDKLLHPDVLFGHTDGHADDKETYLAKFRSGAVHYFDAEQRIISVKIIHDTALVSAHLKMRAEFASGSRQLNVIALTVWVHNESWKMIAHQPTVTNF